jgi:hypothetical protein
LYPLQVVDVDGVRVVVIEELEYLADAVFRLAVAQLRRDGVQELVEIYLRAICLWELTNPSFSRSAIMLKIVGFFESKPRLYMAAFNSRGST